MRSLETNWLLDSKDKLFHFLKMTKLSKSVISVTFCAKELHYANVYVSPPADRSRICLTCLKRHRGRMRQLRKSTLIASVNP